MTEPTTVIVIKRPNVGRAVRGAGRALQRIDDVPDNPGPAPRSPALWWRPETVLLAMMGLYVGLFGWLTWLQQANFGTFDFDMGVYDQEIWLAAHHLNPFVTIRGLNMWANHVNPIVYLLVPFYWLGAGPHFLYLVQTVALAATAVPLWLLARDRLGRPWLALGVPLAWLLYPAVEWMTWWPFQPEYLAVPALAFAYWFADRRRWWWYGLCVALVLMTKEDAAFPVLALGLILLWRHRRRAGLITLGAAAAWLVICLEAIMPAATPTAGPFFMYQYSQLGTGVWSVIGNAIRRPGLVLGPIFSWDRVHYYLQLLAPVAFLCALAPVTLLIAVPSLVVNMVNNQGYTYNIQFQYSAFLAVGVFLAAVEGLARWRSARVRAVPLVLVLALVATAIVGNVEWSPSPLNSRQYPAGIWSRQSDPHVAELAALVGMVPASAAVSASYSVVPHLAHRDRIFTWPNPWIRSYFGISETQPREHPGIINYLVLDTTTNGGASVQLLHRLIAPNGPFRVLVERDGALLAVRR